ncbi:pyruvate, phosphate dikinase [Thiothrix nivea]|uniref:Pyruvate, phosphate dikinase n=1 Tax=Thiothrix nivea (strain ATCC 35100 / DSM 5205 / JP2) TaxID=870187 RepID=A0A656HC00_THINJ|nr:pyruvate, phosphate dikinase [Thiothrix nivea]EIJ32980.1 pyruvate phosphate dikinase [Thiothrix nivea DSM 5205]
MTKKWVYSYHEGDGKNKQLLGGKGANLCEITQIGLNVPPGFVISTEACLNYLDQPDHQLPDGVMQQTREQMAALEQATGKQFGSASNPLLVSVRSGSAMSMPGMMDTILNLGLNSQTLEGLIAQTNNERFGYDSYRRFIQLFGKVALGVPDELFDVQFEAVKKDAGVQADIGLQAADLKEISQRFLSVVRNHTGKPFPEDPYEQLEIAIKAVFNSWMGKRAVDYRREFQITREMANGTAVNVVTMVFGNMGNDCATGVGFTRNPGTGENILYGEYLTNAQGEDVVAGIRTPKALQEMAREMPGLYTQLLDLRNKLERHYREIQDFEFTIEKGVLYCLQTRNGKMNASAMVRTSVEMVRENLISEEEALLRINPQHLEQMLYPRLDPSFKGEALATGLPASPGAASGQAVFDADRAEQLGNQGIKVILVREETKPEDIHGFFAARGILTSRGGKTSHAAVVARGMGKPCVAGAEGIHVDVQLRKAFVGNTVIKEGDVITLDGTRGDIFLGEIPKVEPDFSEELVTLLSWADKVARLKVMANADTPVDAARALKYGAMGIGLCRTERMFNAVDRLPLVIDMIVADTPEQRQAALDLLLPIQRGDFKELFKTMSPRPVTVRLLDPPIHEFLPSEQQLVDELEQLHHLRLSVQGMEVVVETARVMASSHGEALPSSVHELGDTRLVDSIITRKSQILNKVRALREVNPMLGHRGVRLGITFPEIYTMQIRAVLEAAADCVKAGIPVAPEIMVPQVCTVQELKYVKRLAQAVHQQVEATFGVKVDYHFGSMMEVVRACMRADSLAEEAQFFSFGTNDLTQASFSFSREDAENKFLPMYNDRGILQDNPFEVLDVKGVGRLMGLAVEWGRSAHPNLKVGICGEHGGHPASIRFCDEIGLNYVSCSGPRVPIARLAAAHAQILAGKKNTD